MWNDMEVIVEVIIQALYCASPNWLCSHTSWRHREYECMWIPDYLSPLKDVLEFCEVLSFYSEGRFPTHYVTIYIYTSRASHVTVCACSVCVQLLVVWHVLFSYYSCLNILLEWENTSTGAFCTADVWPVVSCIFNCRIFYPALSCSQPFWVRAHRSHGMSPAKMAADKLLKQSEGSSVQTDFKCNVSIIIGVILSLTRNCIVYRNNCSFERFWPILMLRKHSVYNNYFVD